MRKQGQELQEIDRPKENVRDTSPKVMRRGARLVPKREGRVNRDASKPLIPNREGRRLTGQGPVNAHEAIQAEIKAKGEAKLAVRDIVTGPVLSFRAQAKANRSKLKFKLKTEAKKSKKKGK